jgi:iron complex transport system substrate-binding protein
LKQNLFLLLLLLHFGCKDVQKGQFPTQTAVKEVSVTHANGFTIEKSGDLTLIKITSPWPDAESVFTYALIPKDKLAAMTLNKEAYDAIVAVPIDNIVVTSTTHIPALEALGVLNKLSGFPDTQYISSEEARKRIDNGAIKELGNNESLNTEMVIALNPELVVGFGINAQNKAYETISRSDIPVVYNGDWTENTPLGKAEWIKFFAPFFQKEKEAEGIFKEIETAYSAAEEIAKKATSVPTVMSGAMYKDVWYLPGGNSWAAQFIKDANANYLWQGTPETGSHSLSWESVLQKAELADFWVAPAQFTAYKDMKDASLHYPQFKPFKERRIYTFANTLGATGGLLYYELAPQRPDLVLKDLIHIFHPELLPEHQPFFFKPLE